MTKQHTIGWVGAGGRMGFAMAKRLLDAGYTVTAYNRTRSKVEPLAESGAKIADSLRALVPSYDLVLTYGGGRPVVDAYRALGARACAPIYNALDTSTHHPVPPEARFEADLTFLGNRMPDREVRVERFFFEPAARLPERRFLLGGSIQPSEFGKLALVMRTPDEESDPEALIRRFYSASGYDLVLVEGYKRESHPKIEARRRATLKQAPLAPGDRSIVAVAADYDADGAGRPVFALDDVAAIADFIAGHLGLDTAHG